MDLSLLLNSKAASSAAAAMFAPDTGPNVSGAPADLRTTISNAGWTVATGSGSAEGATMSDPIAAAYGPGVTSGAPMQAGVSTLAAAALALVALGLIIRKRKG